MEIELGTGRILRGPLRPIYVYETPVRIWHWLTAIAFVVLAVTGYLIGSPPPAVGGEAYASFMFGYIRMIHLSAGYLLAVLMLVRIYWAIVGNHHARTIFIPQMWRRAWWVGLKDQTMHYLFLRRETDLWVGHNPLAEMAMLFVFVLGTLFLILTGFALYAQQWAWGTGYMRLFGWVFVLLGDAQNVRSLHHLAMWYVGVLFVAVHIYMVFREDIMSGESIVSTMINGVRLFKRPAETIAESERSGLAPALERKHPR